MNLKLMHSLIEELKLPSFREKQIRRAYFNELRNGWSDVSVLAKDLREKFAEAVEWNDVNELRIAKTKDTVKAALKTADGEVIEAVLIKHGDGRRTVCVSSQVGCPMRCSFCATGKSGFKRNLEIEEIIDQVLYFARILKENDEKITNIVFMGMGEPLLNYDNVVKAIRLLNDPEGFGLGARHISISTCGIVPGIQKLAKEKLQINVALSMHAPTDRLRGKLMPVNDQYNLSQVMEAIDYYIKNTNRRVMIEYLMIKDANDRVEDAKNLAEVLKMRPLCYVNLIPYNETGGAFSASSRDNIKRFTDVLKENNVRFTIRHSFGDSIDAACGQLARKS